MPDERPTPSEMSVGDINALLRERVARRMRDGSYTEGDLARIMGIELSLDARKRSSGQWQGQIDRLHRLWDTAQMPVITSHRPVLGKAFVLGKKAVWTLFGPVARVFINPQREFNADLVRVLNSMAKALEKVTEELEDQSVKIVELRGLTRRVDFLSGMLHAPEAGEGSKPVVQRREQKAGTDDSLALAFEEAFRGSREDISRRQASYLARFEGMGPVLDIGCGRGEFVDLLVKAGIEARGVDLNGAMVAEARRAGLDVVVADGIAHLQSLPEGSLGGIFAAQVVEHLGAEEVLALVREARRVLREGGILVLETLNPKCLAIFTGQFYLDPSHRNPVHPETLSFLASGVGFRETEVVELAPFPPGAKLQLVHRDDHLDPEITRMFDAVNRGFDQLNHLIYGNQEYALIAKR
jgi:O-antigen chain-terminating methyltransferase